jgi:hypothetical protein
LERGERLERENRYKIRNKCVVKVPNDLKAENTGSQNSHSKIAVTFGYFVT